MKNKKSFFNQLGKPVIFSLVLHVIAIALLIWGGDFSEQPKVSSGGMVQAVVIDPSVIRQQAEQIKAQRASAERQEQDRIKKLREQAQRLEANRKVEEERIRKLREQKAKEEQAARKAQQKRIEQEKQRKAEEKRAAKAEAERKAKEAALKKAEQKRIAREKAAKKAEQERIAKEKAAQKAAEKARREKEAAEKAEKARIAKEKAAKAAAEKARIEKARLKRLEQKRKEQEAAMNNIFQGLESENKQINTARGQQIASEVEKYGAIYKQLIQQNLRIEDSFKGKSCRINLRLIPAGKGALVGGVSILEGDSAVCAATRRAIAQVESFPLPKDDADVVKRLRNINLLVVPE
ncbi:cell envelope integrity protein TolA [Vibrio sp. DNF-1]|nr:cell envelope integrity protein TolA [Vibrio salinus]MCE0492814.1 cell envelope integrity protein TolA [Vibrio salinus]